MSWSRIRWGLVVLVTIAMSLGIAQAIQTATDAVRETQRSDKERAVMVVELRQQRDATDLLTQQIESLGEEPVVKESAPVPRNVRYVPIPGPRGPGPTVDQLDGAQRRYCADRDECSGEDGGVGQTGAPGLSIQGDTGDTGDAGAKGESGRSVTTTTCNPEGKFVMHYSDETSQVVKDSSCRPSVIPPNNPS